MRAKARQEGGFALLSSLLMLALLATFSVGLLYIVQTEARRSASGMESTQAWYGAAAAMEKMVVDLNELVATQTVPSVSAIEALGGTSYRPAIPDVTYLSYLVDVPDTGGTPNVEIRTISAGPNQGLVAYITPVDMSVTAATVSGGTISMQRSVEFSSIPVFQFDVFSDSDLAFLLDSGLDLAGRVHTNGNLFLAAGSTDLIFRKRVTAAGEVIRQELPNGLSITTQGLTGRVKFPTAPQGCEGASPPACRELAATEASKVGGPSSAENDDWPNLSESVYNGMILNQDTGVQSLLPSFVTAGTGAIELIRRPRSGESPTSVLGQARLYNQAQIRILISDSKADLPGGNGIRLANVAPYYQAGTYGATDTAFAEDASANPLIDGFLLVQVRQASGSYVDVTQEWLNLGISRQNDDAILRFQTLEDTNGDGTEDYADTATNRRNPDAFQTLNLYDTREGELRDVRGPDTTCALGGIFNTVELNVDKLRKWLAGLIGSSGSSVESASQNGYLLYFSDRRGMLPEADGVVRGAYGFEDVVNPMSSAGTPNGTLDQGEDFNASGTLEVYGAGNLGDGFSVANDDPTLRVSCVSTARLDRVSGARHALELVKGKDNKLPKRPDGSGGFTVASENPVYVKGPYNAQDLGWEPAAVPAAVIADAVTFLSRDWKDLNSFRSPRDPMGRRARKTYYRVAVVTGKSLTFSHPSWSSSMHDGLAGGVRHMIRTLEEWPAPEPLYFEGSLVSLFTSQYATGTYKCCNAVFSLADFRHTFDTALRDPSLLPPGTPLLYDVVTLGFRQVF